MRRARRPRGRRRGERPISTCSSVLEVREQSPAGDDTRPQRERQARGQPRLQRGGGAAIPPGDLAERAKMKDRSVESSQHEEQELQPERGLPANSVAWATNMSPPVGTIRSTLARAQVSR